jgi:hypothetical protein
MLHAKPRFQFADRVSFRALRVFAPADLSDSIRRQRKLITKWNGYQQDFTQSASSWLAEAMET